MLYPRHNTIASATLLVLHVVVSIQFASAEPVDFGRDVAPILERRCLSCHNDRDRRGELSLQSARSTSQGGESGEVIVPGDPQSSYLLDLLMPADGTAEMPKDEPPLDSQEIDIIRQWITSGASWPTDLLLTPPTSWALARLQRPAVPIDDESGIAFTPRNAIDEFVAVQLRTANLEPAPPANRRTLIRRLYLDLLGLPPAPDAVESFVADESAFAYERQVDELLASPYFGERWGRYWLDLARYADSDGYLGDSLRPHAWVYREWVIDAFNRDLPFDEFTIEQLAGDLLDHPTLEQQIATGFHRNTLRNTEAGVDLELYRTKEVVDRVNTTGMVWLGLTLGCAECHDHKHDPISQQEFYQLYAFFNNADEVGVTATKSWETAEYQHAMQSWRSGLDELKQELQRYQIEKLTPEQAEEINKTLDDPKASPEFKGIEPYFRTKDPGWNEVRSQLEVHLKNKPGAPMTKAPVFKERTKDRRETFVHIRGVYNRHGEAVNPATPSVLPDLQARGSVPDRLDLARWLFAEDNPLTARVAVNRIWRQLFGDGLVATPNDFGIKGTPPTHPQLLDWLASEYRRSGWSRKAMIRLIVTSSAYRRSSSSNAISHQQSTNNQLLWRQNSYRVSAETVRDVHLAASGLLDGTIGRRGIRPPLPAFVTEVGRSVQWPVSEGAERYRRGMYIVFKRTVPYPMLMTFDAPDATVSCSRRERSNTPLQALTLLNDSTFYECAEVLGQRMIQQYPDDLPGAIDEIFLQCLARPATPQEREKLTIAYQDLVRLSATDQTTTEAAPELLAMIAVARVVMNLDEFITRD